MTRERVPTERVLAARAAAAERRRAAKEAERLDPNTPRNKRMRLARQLVQAVLGLPEIPPETHPEVLSVVRGHRRFPTQDLYALRDRAVRMRQNAERLAAKYPNDNQATLPDPKGTPE